MEFNAKEMKREEIVELLDKWYEAGQLTTISMLNRNGNRYEAVKLKQSGVLLSLYAEGIYTTDQEVREQFNELWKHMRIFKRNVIESDADLTTLYAINKEVRAGAFSKFDKLGKLNVLYIE